jgi:Protein of unknown function (DUF3443)
LRNLFALLICVSLLLAGCGGGGGGTVTTSSGGSGSGGSGSGGSGSGGSGSGGSGGSTTAYNVVNAIVDQGPAALAAANPPEAAVNIMFVNVTICAPGSTTNCQTIDHVQVDTGSQGLRILSSAITDSTLLSALKPVTLSGGGQLAECTQFVDGFSWGAIVTVDMHIGGSDTATTGESAPGIPMQIIGTTTYPVATDCSTNAVNTNPENTVAQFGANGIIGVGLFDEDCGSPCAPGTGTAGVENGDDYFSCTSSSCAEVLVPAASQVINPVTALTAVSGVTDNNGVVIELPPVGATGAATVTGTLIFGIGTQSNNALPSSATVLTTDSYYGYVTTSNITGLGQQTDSESYLDSGSNALYFNDNNIPQCSMSSIASGFFCPSPSPTDLTATITGQNGQQTVVDFSVANATTLFTNENSFAAFSNLAAPTGTSQQDGVTFGWGLPIFFGNNVYTAMENEDAGGTSGPYFAIVAQ